MTTYYVDPAGLATNDGLSISTPWSLRKAIGSTGATAGDTIYIRGGTYPAGCYLFTASGALGNPIVLRPYVANGVAEQFTIDGYAQYQLTSDIDDVEETIPLTADPDPVTRIVVSHIGRAILICEPEGTHPECFGVNSGGANGVSVEVLRGYNTTGSGVGGGAPGWAHLAGSLVYLSTETIRFEGSHIQWWFIDPDGATPWLRSKMVLSNPKREFNTEFGVSRSSWQRGSSNFYINDGTTDPAGIEIYFPLCQDTHDGFYVTQDSATGGGHRFVGCIMQNGGHVDVGRGHGSATYLHSSTPGGIEIYGMVALNMFHHGLRASAVNNVIKDIVFDHCISANNAAPSNYTGSPAPGSLDSRDANCSLGSSNSDPPEGLELLDSALYHPIINSSPSGASPNLVFGYSVTPGVSGATMKLEDSWVIGGYQLIDVGKSNYAVSIQRNVFIGTPALGNYFKTNTTADSQIANWDIDNNEYHNPSPGNVRGWTWVSNHTHLNSNNGGSLNYENDSNKSWKEQTADPAHGNNAQDVNSTYDTTLPVTVAFKQMLFPEMSTVSYIAIRNLNDDTSVSLPTTLFTAMGFVVGQAYRIHNLFDHDVDIVTGTYNGTAVTYSMDPNDRSTAVPLGFTTEDAELVTYPTFGAIALYSGEQADFDDSPVRYERSAVMMRKITRR